ncbi:hypothetical protein PR048_013643 [Dryococelus australis]|uniref:HAT C-terminal dimerisation domain-containing protein n=1 Tax=Dryococelus australis TaxID=614101 RepID=A0ABQ9HSS3_9NEOP|nr:hypothetical protein PR048_013643 [Dryococelus australis]
MQFMQGDAIEIGKDSPTGIQQLMSPIPPATSIDTVSANNYDETVNAIDGMIESVCGESTLVMSAGEVDGHQNKWSSTLNNNDELTPPTKKSKLDIDDETGSEDDHEDSIDDSTSRVKIQKSTIKGNCLPRWPPGNITTWQPVGFYAPVPADTDPLSYTEAARWKYVLATNCWPTMSGLRWLDVSTMPGLRRLDVITMPGLRRLDVITMPGRQRHDVQKLARGAGMKGQGKREIPAKTRRPTASSGTIPTCENPVTRPGFEPGSPWWAVALENIKAVSWPVNEIFILLRLFGDINALESFRGVGGSKGQRKGEQRGGHSLLRPQFVKRPQTAELRCRYDETDVKKKCSSDGMTECNFKEAGEPQENILVNDSARHVSCAKKFGVTPSVIEPLSPWWKANNSRYPKVSLLVRIFASHQDEPHSIPGGMAPGFSQVGIVSDDDADRRVFSGIFRFPRPCVPALLNNHLTSPSLTLRTSHFLVKMVIGNIFVAS